MGEIEPHETSNKVATNESSNSSSTPSGGASIDRHIVNGVQGSLNTKDERNKLPQESFESRLKQVSLDDQHISSTEDSVNAFDECLSHSVAAILLSLNVTTQPSALRELTRMAEKYISALVSDLHGITLIQRRHYPSVRDVKVLVKRGRLNLQDVQEEYSRCREISSSMKGVSRSIEKQSLEAQQEDANLEVANFVSDASSCFFSDVLENISQVVPLRTKRKPYVTKWMPRFPPDHTYKASAQFKERVTDPKLIKERLLREGRLGEKALYKLVRERPSSEEIVGKGDAEGEDLNEDLNGDLSEELSGELSGDFNGDTNKDSSKDSNGDLNGDLNGKDLGKDSLSIEEDSDSKDSQENSFMPLQETINANEPTTEHDETRKSEIKNETKQFDIAAYATKRLNKLEKRKRGFEQKCKTRMQDPLIPVEKHLGSFGPSKVDESLPGLISDLIDEDYSHLLHALKAAEKRKSKRIEEEAKKRRRMQKEFEERHGFTEFNVEEDDVFDQEGDLNFSFDFDDADQPPESREVTEPPEHTMANPPAYLSSKLHEQFPPPQNEPDLFEGVSFEDVDGEQ